MFRIRRRGQSTVEYAVLIMIVIGALLGIQNYFKRGLQGRWKAGLDEIGDQYDPRTTTGNIKHVLRANTITYITAMNTINGMWTFRSDSSNSIETKKGSLEVGGY